MGHCWFLDSVINILDFISGMRAGKAGACFVQCSVVCSVLCVYTSCLRGMYSVIFFGGQLSGMTAGDLAFNSGFWFIFV